MKEGKTGCISCSELVSHSFRHPNFVSAQYLEIELMELDQILRSSLGLLCVNFSNYTTQLWPLVIIKISFPHNTLKRN